MKLIAELTMPSNNAWNGRWSGQDDKFTKAISVAKNKTEEMIGSYRYDFGDGWAANVSIRKPNPREKATNRFCGYEWMIHSIMSKGEITI